MPSTTAASGLDLRWVADTAEKPTWQPCLYNADSTDLMSPDGRLLGWVFFSRGEWTAVHQSGHTSRYAGHPTEAAARTWVEQAVARLGGGHGA